MKKIKYLKSRNRNKNNKGESMGNVYIDRRTEEKIIELRVKGKHRMSVQEFVKEAVREKLEKLKEGGE